MARLGELERAVMEVLWAAGQQGRSPVTARDVIEALPDRELATTTVLTVLSRLEAKNLVVRIRDGRAHHYQHPAAPQVRRVRQHHSDHRPEDRRHQRRDDHRSDHGRGGIAHHARGGDHRREQEQHPEPAQPAPALGTLEEDLLPNARNVDVHAHCLNRNLPRCILRMR